MRLAVMTLFFCAAAAFSPFASALDEAALVQQRIDRLEEEQASIKAQSYEISGQTTVRAALAAASYDRDAISKRMDSLDAAIQQLQDLRADLVRSRILRDEQNLYTRQDGREELAQHIGEEIVLIGLSNAAKTYAGGAGAAAFLGETVYRYTWKLENLSQLDELIATNDRNLGELRDLRLKLQTARGVELQKIARLQALRRRDMEVFAELAEAHAQLASLRPPPGPPVATQPAAPAKPRGSGVRLCDPSQAHRPVGVRPAQRASGAATNADKRRAPPAKVEETVAIGDACRDIIGPWTLQESIQVHGRSAPMGAPRRAEIVSAAGASGQDALPRYELYGPDRASARNGPLMRCTRDGYQLSCQRRAQQQACPSAKYQWAPLTLTIATDVSAIAGELRQTWLMDPRNDPSGCTVVAGGMGVVAIRLVPLK